MADFGLTDRVRELNLAAVAVARRAVDEMNLPHARPAAVRGRLDRSDEQAALGRRQRQRSGLSRVTFDQMVDNYYEQIDALVEGGVDMLLAETAFDTLVLKACLFAIDKYFDDHDVRLPVMASFTIFEGGPHAVGPDGRSLLEFDLALPICCQRRHQLRLGARQAAALHRRAVAASRRSTSVAIRTPGLPNAFGGFDETPEMMAATLGEFARNGWLNIVGGCCGTTPAHIRAIAAGRGRHAAAEAAAARAADRGSAGWSRWCCGRTATSR